LALIVYFPISVLFCLIGSIQGRVSEIFDKSRGEFFCQCLVKNDTSNPVLNHRKREKQLNSLSGYHLQYSANIVTAVNVGILVFFLVLI